MANKGTSNDAKVPFDWLFCNIAQFSGKRSSGSPPNLSEKAKIYDSTIHINLP